MTIKTLMRVGVLTKWLGHQLIRGFNLIVAVSKPELLI